jgi:dimethylargininase
VVTTVSPTFKAPFVRSDAGTLRGVLLVRPSEGVTGLAPVQGEPSPILERAREQHAVFASRLAALGVKTLFAETAERAPSGVLCADGAVIFPDGAFLMRPSDLQRRAEIPPIEAALDRAQIPIVGRIEAPGLLDGGDVLLAGGTLYLGVSTPRRAETGIPRAAHGNALGREQLAAYARAKQIKVVEVAMAAGVKRLRSVAALIDAQTILFAAGLLDGDAFAGLQRLEAPRGEDYGAGVLALGGRRVLANLRFRETIPLLRKAKFSVDALDLWEFGKVGATPSSLALALKRD